MNLRMVAARAGVSTATVSRVVNGSPLVSPEMVARVRRVMDDMHFLPKPVATTLKYDLSRTFGLILPDITNPFYPEFLANFEELLAEVRHELMLILLGPNEKAPLHSVRRMLLREVDGVVLLASAFESRAIEPLLVQKVPLVTLDRRHVEAGISDVAMDFESGYRQAVKHLVALGHQKIGFIGGMDGLKTSATRLNAFRQALHGHGLSFSPESFEEGDFSMEGGERAVIRLLARKAPFTALVTANDLTAIGALHGLHRAGIEVPRQISVVGMDDIAMSRVLQPPLTTVRLDRKQIATACLDGLEYNKKHLGAPGRQFTIAATLMVRSSTAPLHPRPSR